MGQPLIKFQNPRTTTSGRKVTQAGRKKYIEKQAQKEHRGLWFMNASWSVFVWGSEMQASHCSVTFMCSFSAEGYKGVHELNIYLIKQVIWITNMMIVEEWEPINILNWM